LVDRSIKNPHGLVEDVFVNVDKFMFPVNFFVMNIEEDNDVPLDGRRPWWGPITRSFAKQIEK